MTEHSQVPAMSPFGSLSELETLRGFAENLREGLYIASADGHFLDANPAFLAMLGMGSVEELMTYTTGELVVDVGRRREELALLDRDGAVREFELDLRRPDGQLCRVLDTIYLRRDPVSDARFYHGIMVDITKRMELEFQLRELSVRDPLTGCYNRRFLVEMERRLHEHHEGAWGCIFVDIDFFKQYNDRYGHQKGDEVLLKMSRFLIRQVRAEEAVERLGGEEFLIVLAGADAARTESVARRLQLAALRTAPAAFSLGWAHRVNDEPFERTMNRADQELLAVRVVERSPEMNRRE